jgi:hypothetical protein
LNSLKKAKKENKDPGKGMGSTKSSGFMCDPIIFYEPGIPSP